MGRPISGLLAHLWTIITVCYCSDCIYNQTFVLVRNIKFIALRDRNGLLSHASLRHKQPIITPRLDANMLARRNHIMGCLCRRKASDNGDFTWCCKIVCDTLDISSPSHNLFYRPRFAGGHLCRLYRNILFTHTSSRTLLPKLDWLRLFGTHEFVRICQNYKYFSPRELIVGNQSAYLIFMTSRIKCFCPLYVVSMLILSAG